MVQNPRQDPMDRSNITPVNVTSIVRKLLTVGMDGKVMPIRRKISGGLEGILDSLEEKEAEEQKNNTKSNLLKDILADRHRRVRARLSLP